MQSFIHAGGPFMYPILLLAIIAAVLFVWRVAQAFRGDKTSLPTALQARTVLHLGVCALVIGIVAQLTGLYRAATAVLEATEISPVILARGIQVSFNTTLLGMYVLVICMLLWLILRAVLAHRSAAV